MNIHIKIGEGCGLFIALLQVALIICKLIGLIDWPWVMVWAPIWGSITLVLGIFLLVVFFYVLLFDKGGR